MNKSRNGYLDHHTANLASGLLLWSADVTGPKAGMGNVRQAESVSRKPGFAGRGRVMRLWLSKSMQGKVLLLWRGVYAEGGCGCFGADGLGSFPP